MTYNRPSLAQAVQMPVKEVSELPIEILSLLHEEVTELKTAAQKAAEHMFAAMSLRYAEAASELRRAKGIDTGTVRIFEGDFTIVADLPKKVSYDQDGLRQVEDQLKDMGEPVEDYIKIKREISERAFDAWPNSLKKMFAPHRTLGVGKGGFKIEPRKEVA